MSKHENGPAEIGIYYEIAPKIVEKLDCLPNSKEIYEKIYQEVVLKCVRFIEEGKEEDAYLLYKNASFDLKKYTDTLWLEECKLMKFVSKISEVANLII